MKKHKIIDTIFFYDEIDMLLFRLTELNEYVDHFIIMESNIDFLGNLKPLFFLENQNLFENWKDKITYLPTSNITSDTISSLHDELKKARCGSNFTLSINRDNIQLTQLNNLKNYLLSTDLSFEDLFEDDSITCSSYKFFCGVLNLSITSDELCRSILLIDMS